MNYLEDKLTKIKKECELHLKRIESASQKMSTFMPLTYEKYLTLSEDEIEHIDQFLFRFAKLQDAMGIRLFKTVLSFLGEEQVKTMPFLDILHKLEQFNIIDSKDTWLELREIRNQLAHEYEDDKDSHVYINAIYEKRKTIERIYHDIKIYLTKRGIADE